MCSSKKISVMIYLLLIVMVLWQSAFSENLTSIEQECFDEINRYRSIRWGEGKHQLKWDSSLAHDALVWIDRLIRTREWYHDPTLTAKNVGEVVWVSRLYTGKDNRPAHAVKDWYEELCDYDGCSFTMLTGHATQVLWKTSTRVGCATGHDARGYHFIIARFYPCGNVNHPWYFSRNVGCGNHKSIINLRRKIDCDEYHVRKRIYRNNV